MDHCQGIPVKDGCKKHPRWLNRMNTNTGKQVDHCVFTALLIHTDALRREKLAMRALFHAGPWCRPAYDSPPSCASSISPLTRRKRAIAASLSSLGNSPGK